MRGFLTIAPRGWRALALACSVGFVVGLAGVAGAQETVRYGLAVASLNHGPALLAGADPSIFAGHGLSMDVTDFRGSANNCVAALLSDAVDLCQIGTTTGVDAIAEGADLVALAVTSGPVAEIVLSSSAAAKLPVAADSPMEERLRALKGLRLVSGGTGTANYVILRQMLSDAGLSIDDIRHSALQDSVAMLESLRHDRIDGAMWGAGATGKMLDEGVAVRWISTASKDLPQISSIPFVTIFAKRSWTEANAQKAEKIHAALVEAIDRMVTDLEGSSRLLRETYFPELDEAIFKDGLTQAVAAAGNFPEAKATASGWQTLLDLQQANTGKDYANVSFERVIMPFARAD
ncbi:ABC transporter substrate-binding protein [Aquamicrobium sp. LC103]|uniref:ABC transporter substrate-binding protein n=1 Tax=Aquamicrobium sp. LC103 TaxID=1120658 RepID=UPI000A3E0D9F|nr:ABC transporter substrate-binding protein [Aquamicrobium sp. LC103]